MIERVIENWLTSSNERQYQLPFCQVLDSEGETVLYVSTHGQLELGMDVLSIDRRGVPKGYQLKQGHVGMFEWRRCQDEVVQLVESQPSYPGIPADAPPHVSFFVTNGNIKDPVLNAINHRNEAWRRRGYGPLKPIGRTELLGRFRQAHGKFFPESPDDLKTFLELYTADGKGPLDKERFAKFVESILPLGNTESTDAEVRRSAASAVLLTTYLNQNRTTANNHWALFDAWVITGSAILCLAAKTRASSSHWEYSFNLCQEQAQSSLGALCVECREDKGNFTQGSPLSDGTVYGARMAILCGLLAAHRLSHLIGAKQDDLAEFIDNFLERNWSKAKAWGESAVPHFVFTALALEVAGRQSLAEGILQNLIGMICALNGPKGPGFPNPYWDTERCLRLYSGLEKNHTESFVGFSYTLWSMVGLLARRWRRQALRSLWYEISEIQCAEVLVQESSELLRWHSSQGVLDTRSAPRPQKWEQLLLGADSPDFSAIPDELKQHPIFLPFFLLVYPHRFRPDAVRLLDNKLSSLALRVP